jgi:hypothetical protein
MQFQQYKAIDVARLRLGPDHVELTATAAQLNALGAAAGAVAIDRLPKVAVVPIAGAALHAGVLSWPNPEGAAIAILRAELDVLTPSAGAATVDIGTTATSATTASDNLIDGVSVASAGLFGNLSEPGTNGKTHQRLAAGKWVTVKEASGDVSALAGNLYLEYVLL